MNKTIYLSIGSNLPPRKKHINSCLIRLKHAFPDQFAVSSLYQTTPYLGVIQPDYYNCCVRFVSEILPFDLLKFCSALEEDLGRVRGEARWQSRTIDIDILLAGDEIIQSPGLILPHYDMHNRDFVLIPLLELDDSLVHPVLGISVRELVSRIDAENRTHPQMLGKPEIDF